MLRTLSFSKMHSLGNDFVILSRLDSSIYLDPAFIRSISHRKFGIGFDQLIVLEAPVSVEADFSFQVFNTNGSSAKQCLNGARALASYIMTQNLVPTASLTLQIGTEFIFAEMVSSTLVKLILEKDSSLFPLESITIENFSYTCDRVTCGNEHVIIWEVKNEEKNKVLSQLRKQGYTLDKFNISFARSLPDKNKVHLETYERGAGKTLSCGSAAVSAYLSLINTIDKSVEQVKVETTTGYVSLGKTDTGKVFLMGPTYHVYTGEFIARYKALEKKTYGAEK